MESVADKEVAAPAAERPAPGARLRAAREAAGISVEAAATAIHLGAAQVRALEQDDHSAFPALIFVSGYIRNYARFLKLDPEPLLAMLQPVKPATPVVRKGAVTPPSRLETAGPVVWLGVLLVVVAASLAWFVMREHAPAPLPEVDPARVAAPPAADPDAGDPTQGPGAFGAAGEAAAPAPDESAEPAAPAGEAPAPIDELVLRLSGVSWIEVTDATGKRLVGRMGAPGEEVRLRGEAPFDVLFGNAPSVALEYNGRPYTGIRADRRNVASFRLERPDEE